MELLYTKFLFFLLLRMVSAYAFFFFFFLLGYMVGDTWGACSLDRVDCQTV